MHKNVFTLHVSFKRKGSYTEDEPDFFSARKSEGLWRTQGHEFQGLFKTTSKIQDLFKVVP